MSLFSRSTVHEGAFGSCCKDLADSMATPSQSMFRVEDNGALYFTVGYVDTVRGTRLVRSGRDVLSICGTQLQTKDGIKKAGRS